MHSKVFSEDPMDSRSAKRTMGEDEVYERSWSSWMAALVIGIVLLAFVGLLTACATVDATSTPYVGAPHPPPTDPARVELAIKYRA
jgi:hypothetical protein